MISWAWKDKMKASICEQLWSSLLVWFDTIDKETYKETVLRKHTKKMLWGSTQKKCYEETNKENFMRKQRIANSIVLLTLRCSIWLQFQKSAFDRHNFVKHTKKCRFTLCWSLINWYESCFWLKFVWYLKFGGYLKFGWYLKFADISNLADISSENYICLCSLNKNFLPIIYTALYPVWCKIVHNL